MDRRQFIPVGRIFFCNFARAKAHMARFPTKCVAPGIRRGLRCIHPPSNEAIEELPMRHAKTACALAAAAILGAVANATASNCYVIVDRSNEVIYQGLTTPVDLSDQGAPEREALRRRGQQLITMDTDRCPAIDRAQIAGKGGPASVEEIVAGMRSAVPFGTAINRAAAAPESTGGINLPTITVPRDTGGGMSVGGPPSGMSIR